MKLNASRVTQKNTMCCLCVYMNMEVVRREVKLNAKKVTLDYLMNAKFVGPQVNELDGF